jgi:acyl carrier protein
MGTTMDYSTRLRQIASTLGLLNNQGELAELDSFAMLDFHASIQETLNVVIPPEEATLDNFRSIGTLDALLRSLDRDAAARAP